MRAKALSTFRTQLWPADEGTVVVCAGQIIDSDPQHVADLARLGLVVAVAEKKQVEKPVETPVEKAPVKKRKGRK